MKSMLEEAARAVAALAAAAVLSLGSHGCAGAGQDHHAVLGGLGPGQRAGRAVEGLHRQDRHQDEVRVRAVAELRRPHAQRAELEGQAVRPDHRRQPVDRRLGRERPLRQAQRLLRQGRHQDGRLHAGHGARLFGVAEGHAELLGAAGDGRRASAGPIARTGSPSPSCRPSSRRSTTATSRRRRPGPSSSRSPSSSRAARSTARRSTAPTSSPSAAPKASRWA